MNLKRHPLLAFYPVSDTAPEFFENPLNQALFPNKVRHAPSPLEHVIYAAKGENVNGFDMEIGRCMKKSNLESDVIFWPAGDQGTTLDKYRHEYPSFRHPDLEDEQVINDAALEVMKHGYPLAPGQVLFHGGAWPTNPTTQQFLPTLLTNRVLSTTLMPGVAAVHAGYHKPGQIWLLTVGADSKTNAIFYPPTGSLGHEYEALIGAGARLQLVDTVDVGENIVILATLT